jgi:hypothetical protein
MLKWNQHPPSSHARLPNQTLNFSPKLQKWSKFLHQSVSKHATPSCFSPSLLCCILKTIQIMPSSYFPTLYIVSSLPLPELGGGEQYLGTSKSVNICPSPLRTNNRKDRALHYTTANPSPLHGFSLLCLSLSLSLPKDINLKVLIKRIFKNCGTMHVARVTCKRVQPTCCDWTKLSFQLK